MLIKTFGSAVYGVEATTITVEVNVLSGNKYYIVGLPDNAVKESLQRVESSLKSNGYYMPRTKLVVSLAPADLRKSGSAFDLPIAIGTLGASEQIVNTGLFEKYIMMGELNLDGTIQPIKGALPIAIQARKEKFKGFPMILKSYDLDKWIAKYFVSKDETYRDTEKRRKDTEKCTIQYLFSISVSFPYHFSIFSVSEFFIRLQLVD